LRSEVEESRRISLSRSLSIPGFLTNFLDDILAAAVVETEISNRLRYRHKQ
jgi:hypothetical protein